MESHSALQILFPILVIVVMFGLGLGLTITDFKRVALYPKASIVGLTSQLIFLPLIALLLINIFSLKPQLAVGFIILASVPGGIISNVLTLLLKGDVALSVTLTALSSVIAVVSTPFWVALALSYFIHSNEPVAISAMQLIFPLAVLTLAPLGLGLFVRNRWPTIVDRCQTAIRMGSSIFIIIGILAFLVGQKENLADSLVQAGLVAATLCVSATLLGYALARLFNLGRSMQGTIAVETGIQNIPLAMTIAVTILGHNPLFAMAPAAYGLITVSLMSVVMVGVFARWPIFRFSADE